MELTSVVIGNDDIDDNDDGNVDNDNDYDGYDDGDDDDNRGASIVSKQELVSMERTHPLLSVPPDAEDSLLFSGRSWSPVRWLCENLGEGEHGQAE